MKNRRVGSAAAGRFGGRTMVRRIDAMTIDPEHARVNLQPFIPPTPIIYDDFPSVQLFPVPFFAPDHGIGAPLAR